MRTVPLHGWVKSSILISPFGPRLPFQVGMPANFRALLWSQLAQEARSAAEQIKNPELKLQVLLVAARYLAMARRAEKAATLTTPQNQKRTE
jgi:hypothetical protein